MVFNWLKKALFAAEYVKIEKAKMQIELDTLNKKVNTNYAMIMNGSGGASEPAQDPIEAMIMQLILSKLGGSNPAGADPLAALLGQSTQVSSPPDPSQQPLDLQDPAIKNVLAKLLGPQQQTLGSDQIGYG